jgi:hypothetical protein
MNSEEYRQKAAKSQKMAEGATSPEMKQTWIEIATRWLDMFRQRRKLETDDFVDGGTNQQSGRRR